MPHRPSQSLSFLPLLPAEVSTLAEAADAQVAELQVPREGEADLGLADLAPASQLVQASGHHLLRDGSGVDEWRGCKCGSICGVLPAASSAWQQRGHMLEMPRPACGARIAPTNKQASVEVAAASPTHIHL